MTGWYLFNFLSWLIEFHTFGSDFVPFGPICASWQTCYFEVFKAIVKLLKDLFLLSLWHLKFGSEAAECLVSTVFSAQKGSHPN
jgi:hypothetical protein